MLPEQPTLDPAADHGPPSEEPWFAHLPCDWTQPLILGPECYSQEQHASNVQLPTQSSTAPSVFQSIVGQSQQAIYGQRYIENAYYTAPSHSVPATQYSTKQGLPIEPHGQVVQNMSLPTDPAQLQTMSTLQPPVEDRAQGPSTLQGASTVKAIRFPAASKPKQRKTRASRAPKRRREDDESDRPEGHTVANQKRVKMPVRRPRVESGSDQLLVVPPREDSKERLHQQPVEQEATWESVPQLKNTIHGASDRAGPSTSPSGDLGGVKEMPEPDFDDKKYAPLREMPFSRSDIHRATNFRPAAKHFIFQCSGCRQFPVPDDLVFFEDGFQALAETHEQECLSGGFWWIRLRSRVDTRGKRRM
ncbi:hypothetical protein FA13DRAFT_1797669 [Coprinellus micaceus]|uniref:Uncharacterized protein n=1 Tax=Coprinellus micaceus TaxID=71717 RepID=A0A4Y7SQ05_COPMI|nr:hypothetical protein FA13DRAFT_1797669 [Coprinellus micaceus]